MQELFGNGCYRYNVDSPVSSADIQCMSHAHTLKLTKTFPVYVPPIIPRINVMFKARLASSISLESKLLHLHQPHKCLSANHFSPEPLSLFDLELFGIVSGKSNSAPKSALEEGGVSLPK